jgi:hypothetical protein
MRTVITPTYNYRHFRTGHLIADAMGTWRLRGVQPGERAPSVELPDAHGQPWSLTAQRGRPVLLHFGSYS